MNVVQGYRPFEGQDAAVAARAVRESVSKSKVRKNNGLSISFIGFQVVVKGYTAFYSGCFYSNKSSALVKQFSLMDLGSGAKQKSSPGRGVPPGRPDPSAEAVSKPFVTQKVGRALRARRGR